MSEDVKSKISELEKELYSKDFSAHRIGDILPPKETAEVPSWEEESRENVAYQEQQAVIRRHYLMKKFVQFSVGFFVLAVAVAAFVWWRGSNIVSGENISIEISAPVAVAGGEQFETKFIITNNNKVTIDASKLLAELPVGFYSAPDKLDLPRLSVDLGKIAPGQSISESVNMMLYGQENTDKSIPITLEYRMAGSNATLKKTSTYSIKISSSPVNVKLSIPKEISSGQEVEFSIEVGSNSSEQIESLLVEVVFPTGFIFDSAIPVPTHGAEVWRITNLAPREKRIIKIMGVVEGQESEDKVTKVSVGTESVKDERLIGIVYNATTETSTITKPFIALDLAVNNVRAHENIAPLNKGVRVDVYWKSNNPTKVTDAIIEVKLKGAALNKYSIYASGGGFYRSIDNTIVWDKSGNKDLAVVEPGASGDMSFSFSPTALGVDAGRLIKNPQIIFEVRARASRTSDVNASENISTLMTGSVKFVTDLKVLAKGLYFTGPFQNIGPIPPRVDRETTYTISLTARNSANNVSNTYVKTTLPIYVKWLDKISPEGEDITYSEATNEVIWNVGRVAAGGTREASFQISFLPSISHINSAPLLTGEITIVATDDFTKTEVVDKKPAITTYISSDPQFGPNDANVLN